MTPFTAKVALALFAAVAAFVVLLCPMLKRMWAKVDAELRGLDGKDPAARFVAECYLDWEICAGSTMFRAAFKDAKSAEASARYHAQLLDDVLPTHYRAEYSNGRPYWEKHEFSINWRVRSLTPSEREQGVRCIWTDVLPGQRGHRGEHAMSHPLFEDAPLRGSLEGYKA